MLLAPAGQVLLSCGSHILKPTSWEARCCITAGDKGMLAQLPSKNTALPGQPGTSRHRVSRCWSWDSFRTLSLGCQRYIMQTGQLSPGSNLLVQGRAS